MRLVSLEIPEPGATGYQNLVRQNPELTRSDATKFGRALKYDTISRKALARAGVGPTGQADEADELSSQELQNWPGYCPHSEFKIPLLREAYFTHQVVEARIGAERVHKWVKE
jgi:hypothetical protein